MKTLLIVSSISILSLVTGCRVIEVENRGEEVARDADGKPVLLSDGSIQTVKKGWTVYHNQHWMITEADSIAASIKKDEISFTMNGLNSRPDGTNLTALVETSFNGACNLTSKIAAAIATCGASTGGDAAMSLATSLYNKFKSSGGDESKASVTTSSNGTVTITDGAVSTSAQCTDGSCTPSATTIE